MPKTASAAPLQHPLSLPQPPPVSAPPAPRYQRLWISLFFPRLSLEAVGADIDAVPWAVVDETHGRQVVRTASQPAREKGVKTGMPLTAAYALCPELETEPRDHSAEQACLTRLADWAGQYSSMVSLEPQALLLEIGASLTLFGGLQPIRAQIEKDLRQQSHAVAFAIAPTPQAALLLSRCGIGECVEEAGALRAVLGKLPPAVLPVTEKQATLLTKLGLRKLHDLWRLPRAGLIQRFGPDFIDYLDRLLGHKPEIRRLHKTAPHFSAHWPFPIETENTTFILHGIEQLLPRLVRFMELRELALNRLQVIFYHADRKASRLELGIRQLCRHEAHILCLLRERLNRERLAAPVLELGLAASEFHPFNAGSPSLFAHDDGPASEWQQMLDRLQIRLGEGAVNRLQLLDDHRPEQSWGYGSPGPAHIEIKRPLWLLSQPQRLHGGLKRIELISEKERIEGGWWDGVDIRRDYYRARDSYGRRLWLFHDLKNGAWYLHGLFG